MSFTLVLPIKDVARAKTRLCLSGHERREVMTAFVTHVLHVAAQATLVDAVVVVGSVELVPPDHEVQHVLDPRLGGLNGAVRAARSWACEHRPVHPVAVLPVDLPGLTASELDAALVLGQAAGLAFVPDHVGVGTTLVTAPSPPHLWTSYGDHSARRHREHGLVALPAGPGLRQDVDTPADLVRMREARLLRA